MHFSFILNPVNASGGCKWCCVSAQQNLEKKASANALFLDSPQHFLNFISGLFQCPKHPLATALHG